MLLRGLVVKEQSGFFWVELDDSRVVVCRLRGRLLEQAQASDVAAIGDHVWISLNEDASGNIESVEPRTSALTRSVRTEGLRGAGAPDREQVLIANADQALFVFAAQSPAPNLWLLDRFLVTGEKAGIPELVIVVNKMDLDDDGRAACLFEPYRALGYTVLFTSAHNGRGVDDLRARLANRISVFSGPSGVGKSSLLNAIEPGLARSVKAVSRANQEGTHTTRDSVLVRLQNGGYVADTPGLRQLNLWDIEPTELDGYYREIAPLVAQCRFHDCQHRTEPGCAVRAAVASGAVQRSRYQGYLALRDELDAAYALG